MQRTFGKYEVIEKIGEGGFGEVFQGRDPVLKRFVAIKTCKSLHRELRERFVREAEISARLQHPNVTIVHDFGDQDGTPYLVQEFLGGDDLSTLLRRGEPADRVARVEILLEVAAGLAHAHGQGVVHRDLKPQNVRVLEEGRVKIMDFGIAKLMAAEQQLTQVGMTMGTAGYLPPEQLLGQEVDHRADVFSFGVLTYELMTGRRPFEGDDISTIFYRIAHEQPRPMRELWRECPPALEAIVERCLKKDRKQRFADFGELIPELEAVAESWREARTEVRPADLAGPTIAVADRSLADTGAPTLARSELYRPPSRGAPVAAPAPPSAGVAAPGVAAPGVDTAGRSSAYRTAMRGRGRGVFAALLLAGVAAGAGWWLLRDGDGTTSDTPQAGASPSAADPAPPPPVPVTPPGAPPPPPVTPIPSPVAPASVAPPPVAPASVSPPPTLVTPPPPTVPPAASGRFALVLAGDELVAAAESVLLARLAGVRVVGAATAPGLGGDAGFAALFGGDPAVAARVGGGLGAGLVVVARLRSEAAPSVGRFFTGRASVDLRLLRAATGEVLETKAVRIGSGGTPGKLEPSEATARTAAAEAAAGEAADVVAAWVAARGGG